MDPIRTIQSEASNWKFDTEKHLYVRLRRTDPPPWSSQVSYTEEWEPYVVVVPERKHLMVFRPVPWGQGCLRSTGNVLHDSHEGEPWDAPEEERLLQLAEPALKVYRTMV